MSRPAGRVAASVVVQAQSDPETRRMFREAFSEPLRLESARLLSSGIEQGEFRADLDVPLVLDATAGAIYLRLLLGQSLDVSWSRALVRSILLGCLSNPRAATSTGAA